MSVPDVGDSNLIVKWHSNLKNNHVHYPHRVYSISTLILSNCLILTFLLNSLVYNGIYSLNVD
jgi:hypothetical protein